MTQSVPVRALRASSWCPLSEAIESVLAELALTLARAGPAALPPPGKPAPRGPRAGEFGRRVERATADVKEAPRETVVRRGAMALDASATPAGAAGRALGE